LTDILPGVLAPGTDNTALREILAEQIRSVRDYLSARIESQESTRDQYLISLRERSEYFQDEIGERLSSFQLQLDQRFESSRKLLDERYDTQIKALDKAFIAQETAMRTALEAAEKAVQTALVSAEKAVAKAEVAAEKRFESVNEFRAQLTDQAATFLSRNEADVRINSLAEKLESDTKRSTLNASELELRLTSRLDRMAGEHSGSAGRRVESRLDTGTILQTLSVIAAFAAVVIILIVSKG
jgi:hypothetical protein